MCTAELSGNSPSLAAGSLAFDARDDQTPDGLNVTASRVTPRVVTPVVYTTEVTSCSVEWGPTAACGSSAASPVAGRTQSVMLRELSPSRTYHYRLNITDMAGNSVLSGDITVRSAASPAKGPEGLQVEGACKLQIPDRKSGGK